MVASVLRASPLNKALGEYRELAHEIDVPLWKCKFRVECIS